MTEFREKSCLYDKDFSPRFHGGFGSLARNDRGYRMGRGEKKGIGERRQLKPPPPPPLVKGRRKRIPQKRFDTNESSTLRPPQAEAQGERRSVPPRGFRFIT